MKELRREDELIFLRAGGAIKESRCEKQLEFGEPPMSLLNLQRKSFSRGEQKKGNGKGEGDEAKQYNWREMKEAHGHKQEQRGRKQIYCRQLFERCKFSGERFQRDDIQQAQPERENGEVKIITREQFESSGGETFDGEYMRNDELPHTAIFFIGQSLRRVAEKTYGMNQSESNEAITAEPVE
ncbi:MAG: hypothetical protein AAB354_12625 [candidate division KSB1 bacterium]